MPHYFFEKGPSQGPLSRTPLSPSQQLIICYFYSYIAGFQTFGLLYRRVVRRSIILRLLDIQTFIFGFRLRRRSKNYEIDMPNNR